MKENQRKKMMEEFYKEIEDENLLPEIKELPVKYCEYSETFKLNNKWRKYNSVHEVLYETLMNSLKKKIDDSTKISIKPIDYNRKIKEITIVAKNKNKVEEQKIKIILDKTMNPSLSKKYSKYTEGTLQLRNLDEEMFEFLHKQLAVSENKMTQVIEIKEKKNNVDIDMTSQHEIERIAREMQKQFGGELKLDYKLHTRDHQTQKELYRISATVIFPSVKKKDYIEYNEEPYLIKSIDKKILGINLLKGNKEYIELSENYIKLEPKKTTISQINPVLKIIDPETFQEEKPIFINKKKKNKIKINQTVKAIKYKNYIFIEN